MESISNNEIDHQNPFPGLKPYDVQRSSFFYSYGYRTDDMLSRLRSNRFLTLVGEPGSGKASLVNCSIIPTLVSGFAGKAGSDWDYITFRPGTNPIKNMAMALGHSKIFLDGGKIEPNFADQLEDLLRGSSHGLIQIFEKYRLKEGHNLLIFVDEFEDIFAFGNGADHAEDSLLFISLLLKFIRRSHFPVYVVMTLSSDFLSDTSRYPGLPEIINDSQYMIPKMDVTYLRNIIGHAFSQSPGIQIDAALVSQIAEDFQSKSANNYQIQHVLKAMVDLWYSEKKFDRPISGEHYEKVGRLNGAIEKSANEFYDKLSKIQKRICGYLFRNISLKDKHSRCRAVEILDISRIAKCEPEDVIELINLLSFNQLELVEVIETYDIEERLDSLDDLLKDPLSIVNKYSKISLRNIQLIDSWSKLKSWVEQEKKNAEIFQRLSYATTLFSKGTKSYYMNPELGIALEWYIGENPGKEWAKHYASNFDEAIDYLKQSHKNHQNKIREERLLEEKEIKYRKTKILALVFMIVALGGLSAWAIRESYHEKKESAKLNNLQNLDSLRVLYIDALQNMDSAHIDKLRFKLRGTSDLNRSSLFELKNFAESMIKKDSLCKRGLRAQVNNINAYLYRWAHFSRIDIDSATKATTELLTHFCDSVNTHCGEQMKYLKETGIVCNEE